MVIKISSRHPNCSSPRKGIQMKTNPLSFFPRLALIALLAAALACNFGAAATPGAQATDAPTAERATGEPTGPSKVEIRYAEMGGESSPLGAPIAEETDASDGIGRYRDYEHGSIFWSPDTGAFQVGGAIRTKWNDLGHVEFLGYPITDELIAPDGRGRYNDFQNGSIYWTPETGANAIYGFIYTKWRELGGEAGFLGYPISDEEDNSNGHGRHNEFEGGAIYWTSELGAFEVHGLIYDKWLEMGLEDSYLGLPISDEEPSSDPEYERQSRFEHGVIRWHPNSGAVLYDN
jgi:uncharacterized protein with LGFP repeats